jgi:hypothetical protein
MFDCVQFGAGYVLSRLELLSQRDEAVREEKARMLCMLGHLLKLHQRFGTLRGRGMEDLAKKAHIAVGGMGLCRCWYEC